MRKLAQESGTVINAVLFGAMAGSGVLPLTREACEQAIRHGGRGAEASLRGFAAGYDIAGGTRAAPAAAAPPKRARELDEVLLSRSSGCAITRVSPMRALPPAPRAFLGKETRNSRPRWRASSRSG